MAQMPAWMFRKEALYQNGTVKKGMAFFLAG
jgi:hypothetical protein